MTTLLSDFGSPGDRWPADLRAIMADTGTDNPELAVRHLARRLLDEFCRAFDGVQPPIDLEALASFRGIRMLVGPPQHSEDAELVPDEHGGVGIRLNRCRPVTRQRFSIGHEIGHTLFPGYATEVRHRHGELPQDRPVEQEIERLCDIAASEFLLPVPWFEHDAATVTRCEQFVELAARYGASRDATVRRFVDLSKRPAVAVYFGWQLKPTQESQLRTDCHQTFMFGIDPRADAEAARTLRVQYSVRNAACTGALAGFIPEHKSAKGCQSIYDAARSQECRGAREFIDLVGVSGEFTIWSVPLFTPDEHFGPGGECAVVALLQPIQT